MLCEVKPLKKVQTEWQHDAQCKGIKFQVVGWIGLHMVYSCESKEVNRLKANKILNTFSSKVF